MQIADINVPTHIENPVLMGNVSTKQSKLENLAKYSKSGIITGGYDWHPIVRYVSETRQDFLNAMNKAETAVRLGWYQIKQGNKTAKGANYIPEPNVYFNRLSHTAWKDAAPKASGAMSENEEYGSGKAQSRESEAILIVSGSTTVSYDSNINVKNIKNEDTQTETYLPIFDKYAPIKHNGH